MAEAFAVVAPSPVWRQREPKMTSDSCEFSGVRSAQPRDLRRGRVGSEFLVARRVLPDGSRSVLYGTIEGLVEPTEST